LHCFGHRSTSSQLNLRNTVYMGYFMTCTTCNAEYCNTQFFFLAERHKYEQLSSFGFHPIFCIIRGHFFVWKKRRLTPLYYFNQSRYRSLLCCSGVVGNSLIVWIVLCNPRMRNVTNYFIVNLAVADILVCVFCLPITLLSNLFSGKLHT